MTSTTNSTTNKTATSTTTNTTNSVFIVVTLPATVAQVPNPEPFLYYLGSFPLVAASA